MWKYFSINIYVALYAWIVNVQARVGIASMGMASIEHLWAWPSVDKACVCVCVCMQLDNCYDLQLQNTWTVQ